MLTLTFLYDKISLGSEGRKVMRKYEDLTRLHENREAPRSHYIPYDTLQKALEGNPEKSAFYMLLNGEWNFKY